MAERKERWVALIPQVSLNLTQGPSLIVVPLDSMDDGEKALEATPLAKEAFVFKALHYTRFTEKGESPSEKAAQSPA